jgi:hypothetical protein
MDRRSPRWLAVLWVGVLAAALLAPAAAQADPAATDNPAISDNHPTLTKAAAFDTSRPVRDLPSTRLAATAQIQADEQGDEEEAFEGRLPEAVDHGFSGDGVVQSGTAQPGTSGTRANFEGLSNQDNFNLLGGRVNPPDPNGEVGRNHYVESVNLTFAVYSKTGTLLAGPATLGSLWAGFPITECAEQSGDPVVLYDQAADRWLITQFTTRGIDFPDEPLNLFYNCVAVSTTADPTGSYFRYAFTTGFNFPDYPKYSVYRDTYVLTTREFGILDETIYGIGVYGLERARMLAGDPNARALSFLLDSNRIPISQIGDGLLPADVDGSRQPKSGSSIPLVGTQDNDGPYGATSDALNIWEFNVNWTIPSASIGLKAQLPVAPFDSVFPCAPTARDCLPQPGITDPNQFLDILSYRQRPTFRLAYRNFGDHETMVTNQAVEAAPGVAGVRWYEIQRNDNGRYKLQQQGTYAPGDGVHRWMGSIAMDRKGNMALGYSVVNATNVFPGIRFTGRLAGDRKGQMTLGETTIINGTGVQTSLNSRWGDYTDMTVDPTDDCTFWYVNEYYTAAGQASATNGWQTRIASFKLPHC